LYKADLAKGTKLHQKAESGRVVQRETKRTTEGSLIQKCSSFVNGMKVKAWLVHL
jgi:transposase